MTQHKKVRVKARKIWLTAMASSTFIALAACTPATDANPTHSTQPTTTTSTTSGEPTQNEASTTPLTPPAYPAGIDEFTEDNAIKFVEYYIELINYATLSMNTETLQEMSYESCAFCNDWIDRIERMSSNQERIQSFGIAISRTPRVTHALTEEFILEFHTEQQELVTKDPAGKTRRAFTTGQSSSAIKVLFHDSHWETTQFGEIK